MDSLLDRQLSRVLTTSRPRPPIAVFADDRHRGLHLSRSGDSPEDVLFAMTAATDWNAVLVVAEAVSTRRSDHRHRPGSIGIAMARCGRVRARLVSEGRLQLAEHPDGWLVDACRRVFGLSTAAPTSRVSELTLACWLDAILQLVVAGDDRAPLDWRGCLELLPFAAGDSTRPEIVGARLAATAPTWAHLRRWGAPMVGLTPSAAAWMDDGMFSRWCLGSYPDLGDLRSDLDILIAESTASAIDRCVVAALGA